MAQAPHLVVLLALAMVPADHAENPIFQDLIANGFTAGGTTVRFSAPTLTDGQSPEASLAALKAVAGDDRAVKDLLRDSVTAPFILKTRDVKAGDAVIRVADLWFVVHARLEEVDPARVIRQADDEVVEVANMRVEGKNLGDQDLRERKVIPLPPLEGRNEWYTHISSRLLDRIKVQATDRAIATRSADSVVIAARTDHAFDAEGRFPNRWTTIMRKGAAESGGREKTYDGGVSYAKITRLAAEPGALLVEAHFAYVEPLEWFQGNPILRSKFGVIAQDQIRRLRREIEKKRTPK